MKSITKILKLLKQRWYIVIILVLIGGILVVRSRSNKPVVQTFVHPTIQNLEQTVDVSGTVEASRAAELKFLAGGKLTYLPFTEGAHVRRGQTIASIDARDLAKNLQMSLNDYVSSRDTFEQTTYDNRDNVLNDTLRRLLDKNQNSLNDAVYGVELRSIAISNSSLYSPLDGIVTSLPSLSVGSQVTGADVFEVVDPNSVEFRGEVDEADIGSISVGQTVHIILDAYPNETINAAIKSIALKATPSTQSSGGTVFVVKAYVPNANLFHTRLGMNGSMKIVTSTASDAVTIPLSATIDRNGSTYVNVKVTQGNKVTTVEKQITTGIESDEFVQVQSGLSPADEVVVQK